METYLPFKKNMKWKKMRVKSVSTILRICFGPPIKYVCSKNPSIWPLPHCTHFNKRVTSLKQYMNAVRRTPNHSPLPPYESPFNLGLHLHSYKSYIWKTVLTVLYLALQVPQFNLIHNSSEPMFIVFKIKYDAWNELWT